MKKLYSVLALMMACGCIASAQEASYDHPIALRYLGTIENPDPQPVCLFTTNNPMNEGAFLWAPAGSTVKYTDTSTGIPLSWNWETEGGDLMYPDTQDATITYPDKGTYTFPKLTVTYEGGTSVAEPDWKLKVGGVAELCLADCRTWLETYALGVNYYDNEMGNVNGCLGGTNALDIVGVGNLYMMSLEEGYLDGVNVYLRAKPSRWEEGAKIGIRIWMANIGQDGVTLAAIPLEGNEVKFEDIKTEEDGVWVPIEGGAVAQITCFEPIDLFGKPFIFIDVYGWSNDPATEDLQMLMDVMPNVQMQPEHAHNLLAHNSFVRLQGESDYLRPVSYFGGNYGSFMICPIVRGGETPLGAADSVIADKSTSLSCAVEGQTCTLAGTDGLFTVYDIQGRVRLSGRIANGSSTFNTAELGNGIFIVHTESGQVAKFAIK